MQALLAVLNDQIALTGQIIRQLETQFVGSGWLLIQLKWSFPNQFAIKPYLSRDGELVIFAEPNDGFGSSNSGTLPG